MRIPTTAAALAAATIVLGGCAGTGGSGAGYGSAEQIVPGAIGQQMSAQDRQQVRDALDRGTNNQPVAWRSAKTGTDYRVTPIRSFVGDGGARCRDFDTQATLDGRFQKIRTTACRSGDGWQPVLD